MYTIEFYENSHGDADVWDFLENLRVKSATSKDARIQYNQLLFYIDLLSKNGTRMPEKITKNVDEDIWELRPGNNRVLFLLSRQHVCSASSLPQEEYEDSSKRN